MLVRIGAVLVVGGLAVAGVYWLWLVARAFFRSHEVPLVLKVALPAIGAGLLLLLAAVVRERVRAARKEHFKEVER